MPEYGDTNLANKAVNARTAVGNRQAEGAASVESTKRDQRQKIETLARQLEFCLDTYLKRPSCDQEILTLVHEVFRSLNSALMQGNGEEQLSVEQTQDIKAALVGTSRVLDPGADSYSSIASVEHISLAARFLDMTNRRVGTVNATTGESEIRMKISDKTIGEFVKYRNSL